MLKFEDEANKPPQESAAPPVASVESVSGTKEVEAVPTTPAIQSEAIFTPMPAEVKPIEVAEELASQLAPTQACSVADPVEPAASNTQGAGTAAMDTSAAPTKARKTSRKPAPRQAADVDSSPEEPKPKQARVKRPPVVPSSPVATPALSLPGPCALVYDFYRRASSCVHNRVAPHHAS